MDPVRNPYAPGAGRTPAALVGRLRRAAEDCDWIVVQVEVGAGKSLREALATALHAPLAALARPNAGKRLLRALKTATSFQATLGSDGSWTFGQRAERRSCTCQPRWQGVALRP